jgi:hypothetical protein
MRKIIIGALIGIILTGVGFLVVDFLSYEAQIPKGHVSVKIEIETTKEIDKIILTSTYSNQTIQINGEKETLLIFPNMGEGVFEICCIFQDQSEICSNENYIEAGYAPVLKIKNNEIEITDFY